MSLNFRKCRAGQAHTRPARADFDSLPPCICNRGENQEGEEPAASADRWHWLGPHWSQGRCWGWADSGRSHREQHCLCCWRRTHEDPHPRPELPARIPSGHQWRMGRRCHCSSSLWPRRQDCWNGWSWANRPAFAPEAEAFQLQSPLPWSPPDGSEAREWDRSYIRGGSRCNAAKVWHHCHQHSSHWENKVSLIHLHLISWFCFVEIFVMNLVLSFVEDCLTKKRSQSWRRVFWSWTTLEVRSWTLKQLSMLVRAGTLEVQEVAIYIGFSSLFTQMLDIS